MAAINSYFDIQKPEEVRMRLTVVMTVADWEIVTAKLQSADPENADYWSPSQQLVRMIDEMTRKAKTAFWDSADKSEPKP